MADLLVIATFGGLFLLLIAALVYVVVSTVRDG
jgi:hypothetical protein